MKYKIELNGPIEATNMEEVGRVLDGIVSLAAQNGVELTAYFSKWQKWDDETDNTPTAATEGA